MDRETEKIVRLEKRINALRKALIRIASNPPHLMHDERQQEILCYWPKDNPTEIAKEAIIVDCKASNL